MLVGIVHNTFFVRGFLRLVQLSAFPTTCAARAIKIPYFPDPGTLSLELAVKGVGSRVRSVAAISPRSLAIT
jgi:hypothetical protein